MFIIPEFNPQIENNSDGNSSSSGIVTYKGRIKSLQDALLILEATRLDILPTINRRLTSSERAKYIQDETIFVWNETKCGMKRWTDGKYWSASKVYHSHFLIYKQLIKVDQNKQVDYNGLVKQSFSIVTKDGDRLHLISYYKNNGGKNSKKLDSMYESDESESDDDTSSNVPSQDPKLKNIILSNETYPQNLLNDVPKSKNYKRHSVAQDRITKSTSSSPGKLTKSIPIAYQPIHNQWILSQSAPHHLESQPPLKKQSLDLPPILSPHSRASYDYNDTCALNVLDKAFSI